MKPTIDPMFVACVKEEIADDETVTIVVAAEDDIPAWEERFTDEELDSITFSVRTP
jgi:uncharacterized protein YpmB